MAQRRFGPVQAAGTALIEKEAEKILQPGSLGVTAYLGVLERGDENKLITVQSAKQYAKKCGGRIADSFVPDCALDLFDHSRGSAELHLIRVTDGTGRKASATLWSRAAKMAQVLKVEAHNVGRWAGRKQSLGGVWSVTNTDLTETTLATTKTMLKDEWKGARLYLDGVTTTSYEVVSNTTGGVITVQSGQTMKTDYTASGSSDKGYTLVLENTTKRLEVVVDDGERDPLNEFSMTAYLDGVAQKNWPNLSLDPASDVFVEKVINDDTDNDLILVTVLAGAQNVVFAPDLRPATEHGLLDTLSKLTLTRQLFQATVTTGDCNPTVTIGSTNDTMRFRDRLTFTVSGTGPGFTVTVVSDRFGTVGTGTVADGVVTPTSTTPYLPQFTLTDGSTTMDTGDVITVDFFPMEPNAYKGGYLVPDHDNSRLKRFRIASNDHKSLTIMAGDMTQVGKLGSTTVSTSSTTATFASAVTSVEVAIGDLIAVEYTSGGVTYNEARRVTARGTTTTATLASAFSASVPALTQFRVIKSFMVVSPFALGGGYDGIANLTDADFTKHLDVGASLFRRLKNQRKGLVKLAVPGKTATAIQRAAIDFVESMNWQFRVEIPSTIIDEQNAVDFVNTTIGRSDFAVTNFPSYGYCNDQDKPGLLKLVPLTGQIQGREALSARNFEGYHKAAAGVDMTLPRVVKLPNDTQLDMNEEALNPVGCNVIKLLDGNFVIWGDRTLSRDPAWKWKHQREQMSHYENLLLESFNWIIFAINDPISQSNALAALRSFFYPEWKKRALQGATFEEACKIKIDADNNTAVSRAQGNLNAEIELALADTIERFIVTIGKQGVFESVQ